MVKQPVFTAGGQDGAGRGLHGNKAGAAFLCFRELVHDLSGRGGIADQHDIQPVVQHRLGRVPVVLVDVELCGKCSDDLGPVDIQGILFVQQEVGPLGESLV